jgi:predicted TIM-barrel fold metal-dependent hydrolase
VSRRRFVDSHVHLWDTRVNGWYVFPVPGDDSFGLGLKEPFPDTYLWDDFKRAVASVDLVKWVHVSALTVPREVEAESKWVAGIADKAGIPYAIIGSIDPALPLGEIVATLDREIRNPHYRGIRFLGGLDYQSDHAHGVFKALAARKLVYDAVALPGGIRTAAESLAHHPDLTVVLEHAGWPLFTGAHTYESWRAEMAAFAALPHAYCKLSGLSMVVHTMKIADLRRYYDVCIDLFGARRCMFASNFPIDLLYGKAEELFAAFEAIAASRSAAEAADLFAGTAERAYRL